MLKGGVSVSDELSGRKKKLLYNAIDNYIKVASPITSLLVKQSTLHDLSTATIRNELNALEAMGYLKQLHTSSGRVPTSKGYRFFVDETLRDTKCSERDLKKIRNDLYARTGNLSEIRFWARQIIQLFSFLTVLKIWLFKTLGLCFCCADKCLFWLKQTSAQCQAQ